MSLTQSPSPRSQCCDQGVQPGSAPPPSPGAPVLVSPQLPARHPLGAQAGPRTEAHCGATLLGGRFCGYGKKHGDSFCEVSRR